MRLLIDAVPQSRGRLNWKSTAHWNPFGAGERTAPICLYTSQVRARQCSFCRARQHGINFARQSNENCLARPLWSATCSSVGLMHVFPRWRGSETKERSSPHHFPEVHMTQVSTVLSVEWLETNTLTLIWYYMLLRKRKPGTTKLFITQKWRELRILCWNTNRELIAVCFIHTAKCPFY
jgi:hypothetical protein